MSIESVRLPETLSQRLANLSTQTSRDKSYYIRKALEEFLDAHEDYLLAVARLESQNPRISLEEMVKRLGLED